MSERRALVALDLGDHQTHVLTRAVELCRQVGARPTVAYVFSYDEALPGSREMLRKTQELLHHACERLEVPVREEVIRGDHVATTIVARAHELGASMIVLGSNRRKGLQRLLLGNVTSRVIEETDCDVFVVGGDGVEDAEDEDGEEARA